MVSPQVFPYHCDLYVQSSASLLNASNNKNHFLPPVTNALMKCLLTLQYIFILSAYVFGNETLNFNELSAWDFCVK